VASSRRLRRSQVEDGLVDVMGCVEPYYLCFIIFILLVHRDIIVISLLLEPINRILYEWGFLSFLLFLFHNL
jgi:hypothetical protein